MRCAGGLPSPRNLGPGQAVCRRQVIKGKGKILSTETEILSSETEIRPFRVDMPDEAIADLRRRVAATRWPSKELVQDGSQGVQLATLQELARYWATEYDWRRARRG